MDIRNFVGKVAVKIFLEDNEGNLLIVKQEENEDYEVVGGRIDEGESIQQTIRRELKEELDIDIYDVNFDILNTFQANNPNEGINHFYLIIKIKVTEDQKRQMKLTEEIKEICWINKYNYKDYNYKKFLQQSIEKYIKNK